MSRKAADFDQFQIRLPPGMREQIKRSAEDSGRSMNAEIVDVLREHFPAEQSLSELMDSLGHTIGMLKSLHDGLSKGDKPLGREIDTASGALFLLNEDFSKIIEKRNFAPVVLLRPDAVDAVARFKNEYEMNSIDLDATVSDLVLMAIEQILSGATNYRAYIGEGDTRRMIEIVPPAERKSFSE